MIRRNIFNVCFYILTAVVAVMLVNAFFFIDYQHAFSTDLIVFVFLVSVPIVIIGVYATLQILVKQKPLDKKSKLKIAAVWSIVVLIFILVVLFGGFENTGDYTIFLSKWVHAYQNISIAEAAGKILETSNYTPVYNYLLIIIAQLGFNVMLGIKYITFLFSLLLALAICLIVAFVRKTKFNFLLFLIVMLLPFICIEYVGWGQCDAIYTSFALLSFYFAITKKSKLSFLFVGLSFAFKLQVLFIVPILFVLLIIKDSNGEHYLKWKDIWIAPSVYLINLLPALAGESVIDLLLVYANQAGYDNRLTGNNPNIAGLLAMFVGASGGTMHSLIVAALTGLTVIVLVLFLILIFKTNKRRQLTMNDILFWATAFAFSMVFLMPKMLDRFYYIAVSLCFIYMLCKKTVASKFICLFMNFMLWLTMYSSLFHNYVFSPPTILWIAIPFAFITFGFIIKVAICEYLLPLTKKHEDVNTN